MIEHAFIISLTVLAIHYTMQDGEIFGKLGNWFANNLPPSIHQPVFDCNVCMTPWYGSALYVIIYGVNWQWPIVVIAAMGLNVLYNKWEPKDKQDIHYHSEINSGVMLTPAESEEEKIFQFTPEKEML